MLEKLKPKHITNTNDQTKSIVTESKVVETLKQECESTTGYQTFRFTKEQVQWISYLMDTHVDDFQVIISKKLWLNFTSRAT